MIRKKSRDGKWQILSYFDNFRYIICKNIDSIFFFKEYLKQIFIFFHMMPIHLSNFLDRANWIFIKPFLSLCTKESPIDMNHWRTRKSMRKSTPASQQASLTMNFRNNKSIISAHFRVHCHSNYKNKFVYIKGGCDVCPFPSATMCLITTCTALIFDCNNINSSIPWISLATLETFLKGETKNIFMSFCFIVSAFLCLSESWKALEGWKMFYAFLFHQINWFIIELVRWLMAKMHLKNEDGDFPKNSRLIASGKTKIKHSLKWKRCNKAKEKRESEKCLPSKGWRTT